MSRRSASRTPAKSRAKQPPAEARAKGVTARPTTTGADRESPPTTQTEPDVAPTKNASKPAGKAPAPTKRRPERIQTRNGHTAKSRAHTRSAVAAQRRAARKRAIEQRRQRGLGLRAGLRGLPRAAWVCALVAILNAACWSVISPPFQVPDEPSHFAYVQRLAETGKLPTSSNEIFPTAEEVTLADLDYPEVREHPAIGTISTAAQQRKLEHDLSLPYAVKGNGNAGVATSQPPLYYAIETIPYELEKGGTLLDRLALMRLLSALMAGLTALFAYLFLREALPAARWAWTVGGLGVALTPLLGIMSGAVNPDALLFAISAALFYCLARGFRRGIDPRLAIAIGAVLAVGLMTKLNFIGLLPGALLGLLILCVREARTSRRSAYRCLGLALAVGGSPVLLYAVINALSGRPALSVVAEAIARNGRGGSIFHELIYIWQFYLPRLPGMRSYFHGFPTTRVYWFDGLVGLYGWLDTTFPAWVYSAAIVPAAAIAALAIRALFISRGVLRGRLSEALTYLAMSCGVLLIIGANDYLHKLPGEYAEPRYLLPMLVLWGAILALAARGAGRRWGPVVGVLIVGLALAHDLFSQLLVISRYYG
jgi:hypothetical protein